MARKNSPNKKLVQTQIEDGFKKKNNGKRGERESAKKNQQKPEKKGILTIFIIERICYSPIIVFRRIR